MGAWGTAISSNDTYADIYGLFFELYNKGLAVKEISEKLIASNQDTVNDSNDSNNFWLALAKAQWECKELDPIIFDHVKKIISSGSDVEIWRQSGATEKDIEKRKVVLEKFLVGLKTERPKPKSRKKKIILQPVFEKGDCLTFKFASGNYGGAVVLEAIKSTEYGHNLLAVTRINQTKKPTKSDFENSTVLNINYANWNNKPCIHWYYPIRHKKIAHLIEKVTHIEVQLNYDIKKSLFGNVADFDIWVIGVAGRQFQFEETGQSSPIKRSILELIRKSR